jgi:hypothetical protein
MAGRIGGLWDSVPHALYFAGMMVLPLVAGSVIFGWRKFLSRCRFTSR